jgi:hypothetical protein
MFEAPPAGASRSNISITGNTSDMPSFGTPMLRFNDVTNLTVTGNQQQSRTYPLTCNRCTNTVVGPNQFPRV